MNTIFKIKNKLINSVPIITASLLLALRYFSGQNIVDNYLPIFVATEALIVDICFVFLISKKIKEDKTILDISENQINKGFFLFVNTTAPYYLAINYMSNFQKSPATFLNFIGSIGYIILFYHIYKAIKCSLLK